VKVSRLVQSSKEFQNQDDRGGSIIQGGLPIFDGKVFGD